jgi:hypothetical protein
LVFDDQVATRSLAENRLPFLYFFDCGNSLSGPPWAPLQIMAVLDRASASPARYQPRNEHRAETAATCL